MIKDIFMKNLHINLLSVFCLSLIVSLASTQLGWSFERKVLLEDFTSTTCPPCAASAAALESGLEAAGDDVVASVAIHVWWPGAGNDPWYLDNPPDARQRTTSYYGVNGVPTFKIDGATYAGQRSANAFEAAFRAAQNEEAPVSFNMSAVVFSDQLIVSATLTAEEDLNNVRLYISLNEDYVQYNAPTGQRDHFDAMVKMIPNALGTSFSIESNETKNFNFTQDISELGWHDLELSNLIVVGWVQAADRSVHQAQNVLEITEFSQELNFSDGEDSNDDGRVEPGESGEIKISIFNPENGIDLEDMVITLTTDDENIEIINGVFAFDVLEDGGEINNNSDPIIFRVPDDAVAHPVTFSLEYTSDAHNFSVVIDSKKMVGWPPFLVVTSTPNEIASDWMLSVFGEGNFPWADHYIRTDDEMINMDLLENYDIVLWHTFNENGDVINEFEEASIMDYLDGGGTVVFSSYSYVQQNGDSQLMRDYFHAELDELDTGEHFIHGEADAEFFEGARLYAGGTRNGDAPGAPDESPSLTALDGGVPITYWGNRGGDEHTGTSGVMYDGENFRTLLFSFPIESISGFLATHDLDNFMNRIWTWYNRGENSAPPINGDVPIQFRLESAFPNPFNSSMTIPFSLDRAGMVELNLYDISGRKVTTLVNNFKSIGNYSVNLDGDVVGMSAGVYYLKLTSGNNTESQKILYLK